MAIRLSWLVGAEKATVPTNVHGMIRRVVERGVGELLLLDETGTGKSAIARYAHATSPRRGEAFQTWVARASNADVHYSELFGYWRGAFTDAREHRPGVAEAAHGGTLFIDEIAELTPRGQTALFEYRDRHRSDGLRRVRRMGRCPGAGASGVPANYSRDEDRVLVDTFLITATNKPIQDPAWRERNGFRQEIYNRLGHRVEIPPLRARRADVDPLFRHFLAQAAGRPIELASDVGDRLAAHEWTDGNLAELKTILADWFAPSTRKRSRWEPHPAWARDRARIAEDDVLAALYRYGADEIAWEEAKTTIETALRSG